MEDRLTTYRVGVLQLLLGATMISFSPVFVKLAHVGPTMAGFYRNLFGGVFLVLVVLARRESLWRGMRPFLMAAGCGVLFAADLSFWHRSIDYIGPGLSTIVGNFQVFFLAVFGVLVLRERIDWRLIVSIPMALAGLFLLVGADWGGLEPGYRRGVFLGLLTALIYAAYVLLLKKSQSAEVRLSATANLTVISLITALVMCVEGYLQGESFVIPDSQSRWSLAAYGVICQALGWMVISKGLVKVRASRAGLVLLLQPTLAFVWDILFFGRPTDLGDVAGAALALGAIYLGAVRERG